VNEAERAAEMERNRALFEQYKRTRDRDTRNVLVQHHMRLAESLAARFSDRGEPLDDLRQVALVGLLKAVERFDPARGVQFASFATPTVVGELKRHFRDRGWAVRVPRRVQELHLRLRGLVATLNQELGRAPSTAEVAERAGVLDEDVLEAMEAGSLYRLSSLDAQRADSEGEPAIATIGSPDPELQTVDERLAVEELLGMLPEREQHIVYLRFFEGLTQAEIAKKIGISQMHVSRLLAKSLDTLGSSVSTFVGSRACLVHPTTEHQETCMSAANEPEEIAVDISTGPGKAKGEFLVTVSGEIDVATSPRLRSELIDLLDQKAQSIVLDLGGMSFIDSSGLGVLVGALRRLREQDGSSIVLRGMQPPVRRVFEITGLTDLFTIE
jgi:RNA polymerase sigma-B factor